jgi:hypothetical protein
MSTRSMHPRAKVRARLAHLSQNPATCHVTFTVSKSEPRRVDEPVL